LVHREHLRRAERRRVVTAESERRADAHQTQSVLIGKRKAPPGSQESIRLQVLVCSALRVPVLWVVPSGCAHANDAEACPGGDQRSRWRETANRVRRGRSPSLPSLGRARNPGVDEGAGRGRSPRQEATA
jgi:hypothetical protein